MTVLAAAAVLIGATLQSAVGFGFSLVAAPLVFAAFGPVAAVGLLTVLGLELNLVSLLGERRRPVPYGRVVLTVLAWSVPTMVVGVLVLRSVDAAILQVALSVTVVGSLLVRRRTSARESRAAPGQPGPGRPRAAAAGLASGLLATTTSAAGPPIVLLLSGRGLPPLRVRDTLTASFAGLGILGGAVLAATGTHRAAPSLVTLAAFVPLTAAGQVLGRPLFARLSGGHYDRALTVTLAVSATLGLVGAFT